MVVIPCLSFLNFPVCDFSQREKLVLCSLAADVFVFHCFVIFPLQFVACGCLSFLNFPVCDLSLREKLVLCGLAGRG